MTSSSQASATYGRSTSSGFSQSSQQRSDAFAGRRCRRAPGPPLDTRRRRRRDHGASWAPRPMRAIGPCTSGRRSVAADTGDGTSETGRRRQRCSARPRHPSTTPTMVHEAEPLVEGVIGQLTRRGTPSWAGCRAFPPVPPTVPVLVDRPLLEGLLGVLDSAEPQVRHADSFLFAPRAPTRRAGQPTSAAAPDLWPHVAGVVDVLGLDVVGCD